MCILTLVNGCICVTGHRGDTLSSPSVRKYHRAKRSDCIAGLFSFFPSFSFFRFLSFLLFSFFLSFFFFFFFFVTNLRYKLLPIFRLKYRHK